MGIFSRFSRATGADMADLQLGTADYPVIPLSSLDVTFGEIVSKIRGKSAATLWTEQPYLRTVVTFMARNIAQLGLPIHQRVSETDRQRIRDGRLFEALQRPNRTTTAYELRYALVADLALYDTAYWLIAEDDPENPIVRIPPSWVTPAGGDMLGPDRYLVRANRSGDQRVIPAEQVLAFHGWAPHSGRHGSSPVEALKDILAEQLCAAEYRRQVWERGGRASEVITRPAGAEWSDEARRRFSADWRAKWAGDGPNAGGTPILEDGMTLSKVAFSAHEQEYVEGARLALNTVASVYHINPTMIGLLDNANYSNVREFRKMLYGDTLGPVMAQVEDRLNTFLVPRLDDRDGLYVEFNIEEKLQGNFEEQSAALQAAIGRPWMTADEGRALRNMPALGGDAAELVTPLNVLVGGQASPRDSGSQNRNAAPPHRRLKVRASEAHQEQYERVLAGFFSRQERVVKTALGAKADDPDWWDAARWDAELADDLFQLFATSTPDVARAVLEARGFEPELYDVDRTLKFLKAVAESRAGMINSTTRDRLQIALTDPDTEMTVDSVFDDAKGSRSAEIATTLVTTASAFATAEAASQVGGERATKTWVVTSRNPRASHAQMNGETVPLSENFSNGMAWPGDPAGGADEVAGCLCDLDIDIPTTA